MASSSLTRLDVSSRTPQGSRAVRRMRHAGLVPGVLYGGDGDPVTFSVDARELRVTLAATGAVLELSVDGGRPTPAVVKATQRHAVRGQMVHVDLVRVRLDQAIQATVAVVLTGQEDAPGVREGGVLELITHSVTVEALPTSIPESITHDVSEMVIGDTLHLSAFSVPDGVTLLGELDEIVVATLTPPRLRVEDETEIETETELVGDGDEEASGEGSDDATEEPSAGDGE